VVGHLETQLQGLRASYHGRTKHDVGHVPIRFILSEKLSAADKLMLAFDAVVFSEVARETPSVGEIIYGRDYATTRVPLKKLCPKVRSVLKAIDQQLTNTSPPPLILNRHCANCVYSARCRQVAKEADDLSLLGRMSDKERQRYHRKGIFTVTQLSYTFRHRRRVGTKHDYALKALAVRKNQIHTVGKIEWNFKGTPVYMDVEGDPDRDFYYCIGIRFQSPEGLVERAYWADTPAEEAKIWTECLLMLATIENAAVVHFGSYETTFLQNMKKRYPDADHDGLLDRLISTAINLLSVIYDRVYFPTYSNGLKDIAGHLGFRWSEPTATGLSAVRSRREWEISGEPTLKQNLLTYNADDCAAAQVVAEALSALAIRSSDIATNVVDVSSLKREYPRRFGEVDFALPEFQQINNAAQWDYQRDRIHLRFDSRPKRRVGKATMRPASQPDRIIEVEEEEERPATCIECGSKEIKRWGRNKRVIHDLKVSRTSIKRWIVKYYCPRYICLKCGKTWQTCSHAPGKYGPTIRSYIAYQVIELRLSQNGVARGLIQSFSIPITGRTVNRLKTDAAKRYEAVYERLLDKIARGSLVHADETRARIIGRDVYVWVFTSLEEVAFVLSESREATTAQKFLADFKGVLVSDFYTGYDSIDCSQQRCLIHLMRDINEDLCKQPFNEEMKTIARGFADLLRPIIESVDRFGLKARHLRKHQPAVKRFFEEMFGRTYETDIAVGYQRRFEKARDRLFTFLEHDGIPWNNNNAEHAIKAFARLRNVIGGTSTFKGLREDLVLLSISETCKYKGVRFLDFLLSQESDVDRFVSRTRGRRAPC
jgi:predicted RecB family nuclease